MSIKILLATALTLAALIAIYQPSTQSTHNLITAQEAETYEAFSQWMIQQGKHYRNAEEKVYRFKRFSANYIFVQEHNARFAKGLETFDVEVNKFADLDRYEFKALYTGKKDKATLVCTGTVPKVNPLPQSVDWTVKISTTVKDQGQCGSCWAFSTVGALEGLYALEKGSIKQFSEQQLVDCAGGVYTNEGCNGGDMDAAMWYVIDNGITNETSYVYRAKDQKCAYKSTMKEYGIKKCAEVTANKTDSLREAVANQPVSISVQADQTAFQFYKSGVLSGKCGTNLDHGITLYGYGSLGGKDYWKAKNSWGGSWGQSGYVLIARGADGPGECGILMDNTIPLESA